MPKYGSTRKRQLADLSLEDLAEVVRQSVLSPGAIEAEHIQPNAIKTIQSTNKITERSLNDGSVTYRKLSLSLRHKIDSARQMAEQAVSHTASRFQQEIDNLEGALAAKIERAAALAGNAIQPGVRAFLQSIKTSTVEFGYQSINADTDISSTQATFYKVVTGGGDVTVTLPAANTCPGLMLGFKKAVGANSMIIDGAGAQTINGSTTKTFTAQHDTLVIVSDGSNWLIISNFS